MHLPFGIKALRRAAGSLLLALGLAAAPPAAAQVVADWGTVAVPITSPVTFSFAQVDVTQNFSHQYAFTLEGTADATYSVSLMFDACRNGCGNPALSYGIEGAGTLSDSPTGEYLLAPGTYYFTVRGTGFGSGTTLDYWGDVVIAVADTTMVSPVPEPETYLLALPGIAMVVAAVRRRRRAAKARPGDASHAGATKPRVARLALAAPLLGLLAACSEPTSPRATQVVARVGETEITALQLERALKAQRAPLSVEPDRQQAIDKLIDRELAVQQALARKLDRQPEVMLRLEELRREVLAGAFAEQVAASRPRPAPEAVRAFYERNPELFAQRRIYRLHEMVIPVPSPQLAEARQRLARRQPPAEIAAWLARENARFSRQDVLRAAEQVPLEALRTLHAAAEGQVAIFEAPRALYIYQVLGFQAAPLDLAAATPLIGEHLTRQEADRAMRAELKALRAAAGVEVPDAAAPATKPRA